MKRMLGIGLVVVGIIGLVWGGIRYVESSETVDLGVAEVTVSEKETLPVPPTVGAVALAGGLFLLIAGRRKS